MINTSDAYKDAIRGNREFVISDQITFTDGTKITISLDDLISYQINESTSESGKFQVGAAIIKEYAITLNNYDGKFDGLIFDGADIVTRIGIRLPDGSTEILTKGIYRIIQAKEYEATIKITAYNQMLYFDQPYSKSTLSYPATINQIVQDACTCCQMSFAADSIEMGTIVVSTRPKDDAITFRDVISYCAQIMGCYATINNLGDLYFGWYSFCNDIIVDGGVFDGKSPYATGDTIDGGDFSYSVGDSFDSGNYDITKYYHHFYDLKSKNVNTDDIIITGVQVIADTDNGESVTNVYGESGYMIVIEKNPFIEENNIDLITQHIGKKLTSNCFRPLSLSVQSDPSIESGDAAVISLGWKKSVYTVITNTTFSMGGSQKIECTAETPAEKTYSRFSIGSRIIAKSDQNTEQKISDYDVIVQRISQLAANTIGFFQTVENQDDGSVIIYRHDKPDLSESATIYKSGIDGFWVSQDGGNTWTSGFDSNGNAVVNILSAIGINFDWARGGTLTLGGYNNEHGTLEVYDSNGGLAVKINNAFSDFMGPELLGYGTRIQLGKLYATYKDSLIGSMYAGESTSGDNTVTGMQITFKNFLKFIGDSANYMLLNGSLNPDGNTEKIILYKTIRLKDNVYFENNEYFSNGCYLNPTTYNNAPAIRVYDGGFYARGDMGCSGTKYRIVDTDHYGTVGMNAFETSSPYFSDIGSGNVGDDGIVTIFFDPEFYETIDGECEYQVFITRTSEQKTDWVEKKNGYFIVHGNPGAEFDWMVCAKQKGYGSSRMERIYIEDGEIEFDESIFDGDSNAISELDDMMDEYRREIELI